MDLELLQCQARPGAPCHVPVQLGMRLLLICVGGLQKSSHSSTSGFSSKVINSLSWRYSADFDDNTLESEDLGQTALGIPEGD